MRTLLLLLLCFLGFSLVELHAANIEPAFEKSEQNGLDHDQYAKFPLPLATYADAEKGMSMGERLKHRAGKLNGFNLVALIIFILAIIHTFLAGTFMKLSHHHQEKHNEQIEAEGRTGEAKPHTGAKDDVSFKAHLFHFLGEVEAVFGIWTIALAGAIIYFFGIQGDGIAEGAKQLKLYLGKDVNYTEPLFVVIIMAIAATRPVVRFAEQCVDKVAQIFGGGPAAWWFSALTITPLLGSFITEPAAMTIAAMLLGKKFYEMKPSPQFAYATLGLLFVNISIGGTLTHFAAPPVLMVASKWHWDLPYMFLNFGWKSAIAIVISNALYFFFFRKDFKKLSAPKSEQDMHLPLHWNERNDKIPALVTIVHLSFLAWTVFTAHYPALFIGGFLFLIGFTQATGHHQNDVKMKTPLLVGFFLAALVIHGGCQGWWIEVLLTSITNELTLMIGATVLTALNDNAAITYLASQAPGLTEGAKYAVVVGAVAGGGLTVIANAPNPAGQSILRKYFPGGVSPAKLLAGALIPTLIAGACLMILPNLRAPKHQAHSSAIEHHEEAQMTPSSHAAEEAH